MSLAIGMQGQKAYGLCTTPLCAVLVVQFFPWMNSLWCTTLPLQAKHSNYWLLFGWRSTYGSRGAHLSCEFSTYDLLFFFLLPSKKNPPSSVLLIPSLFWTLQWYQPLFFLLPVWLDWSASTVPHSPCLLLLPSSWWLFSVSFLDCQHPSGSRASKLDLMC